MMLASGNSLWAFQSPEHLKALAAAPRRLTWPTPRQLAAASNAQAKALKAVKGRVAVLPVYGMIQQRWDEWMYWFGGTSTELLGRAMESLAATREVEAIVLDVDSPGGTTYGVQETAELIYNLRSTKPIIAVCNSLMASGAYWLGAAAEQIHMTPGGDAGSVGVYQMHVDYSQALEAEGIKVTFVQAGKYKTEGNSYEPLSDDTRDFMQQSVDETYTTFVKALAKYRGVSVKDVRAKFGEGRCLSAPAALEAKMVDKIGTLRDVLGKLTGSQSTANKAAADVLRRRQAWRKLQAQSFRAK